MSDLQLAGDSPVRRPWSDTVRRFFRQSISGLIIRSALVTVLLFGVTIAFGQWLWCDQTRTNAAVYALIESRAAMHRVENAINTETLAMAKPLLGEPQGGQGREQRASDVIRVALDELAGIGADVVTPKLPALAAAIRQHEKDLDMIRARWHAARDTAAVQSATLALQDDAASRQADALVAELTSAAANATQSQQVRGRKLTLIAAALVSVVTSLLVWMALFTARKIILRVDWTRRKLEDIVEHDLSALVKSVEALGRGELDATNWTVKPAVVPYVGVGSLGALDRVFESIGAAVARIGHAGAEATESHRAATVEIGARVAEVQTSDQIAQNVRGEMFFVAQAIDGAAALLGVAATEFESKLFVIDGNVQAVATGATENQAALAQIGDGVVAMTAASEQVARGAADQATAISRAAADVVTVDASLKAQITASASLTHDIDDLASTAAEASLAMEAFRGRAAEIAATTRLIYDLAEQSNMLALNAAIEAARAGQHGRGFAVVADEVRKLANRSADAARTISTIAVAIRDESAAIANAQTRATDTADKAREGAHQTNRVLADLVVVSARVAGEVDSAAEVVRVNAAAAAQMAGSADNVRASIAPIAATMEAQVHSTASTVMAMEELKDQITRIRVQVETLTAHAAKLAAGGAAEDVFALGDVELF